MSALRHATDYARGVLEATADTRDTTAAADARTLRAALARLVDAVDHDRTARTNAQADEEFHSLTRAARLEIRSARNCLYRLGAFEKELSRLLWGDSEVQP